VVEGHWTSRGPLWMSYRQVTDDLGYARAKEIADYRRLLQAMGTDVGRNMIDEDVWINMMFREVGEWRAAGYSVAVTGLRFPNELERIRAGGGRLVWVERPGVGPVNDHDSERSVTSRDYDYIVQNDGTLADLHDRAQELVTWAWS